MDEETLFVLVNEAIIYAKTQLEQGNVLAPFAMVLYGDENIESLISEEVDYDACYESLVVRLRNMVQQRPDISALVIITRVAIPTQYNADTPNGIRVHLEERHKQGNKVGARFLYVPYQLYKSGQTGKITMQLQTPIPVSFPPEVFV
jgi:hypothetical protein